MKDKLKNIWGRKWLRWTLIVAFLVILGWYFFCGSKGITYEFAPVTRGSVVETVTATGQIKPEQYASLRFKTSGSIAKLNVDVGDKVFTGQILASLNAGDLSKRVTQAEADLVAAEVLFANSIQEVGDQAVRGDQAVKVLYANAPNTFNDILNLTQQAYASFATFYDANGRLASAVATPILVSQRVVDADNVKAKSDVAAQKILIALDNFSVQSGTEKIDLTLSIIHEPLQDLQSGLATLVNAVSSISSGAVSASTLAAYKDTLALARTNMNSAINKESTLASNLRDIVVQNKLTMNSTDASSRSAGANVEKAKAALEIARQNLSEAYLRSPINGTVAVKSKQVGELVTSADQVFYLLGESGYEVVANIPEVDVARIRIGAEAEGTLDAFSSDENFVFITDSIDPDQTTIDGVVYYKTHFLFKNPDSRFRPGMSVNLTMIANQKNDVLTVPRRAVTQRSGVTTVRIAPITGKALPEVRNVVLGLRGDMQVEIISGLSEGEMIVIAEKK